MAKIQYFIFIFSKDQKVVKLINTNATAESPTPLLEAILQTNICAIIKSEFFIPASLGNPKNRCLYVS